MITKEQYVRAMQTKGWLGYSQTQSSSATDETKLQTLLSSLTEEEKPFATGDTLDILLVMDPEERGWVDTWELLEVCVYAASIWMYVYVCTYACLYVCV